MPNELAAETSPYLRQHADNPVAWLPWGPRAHALARDRDRPLLVSIGYSSCHWCHVMERESFEDERTAALMNESFVCVKVDREERPDVDALYMEAVQAMTGQGGWPLNVFLTPEQLPFYGGTYFPPEPRPGMPAWTQVLQAIAEAWDEHRDEIRAGGERLRERLSGTARLKPSAAAPSEQALDDALDALRASYDAPHGGFGGAPKFPQASVIEFMLCRAGAAETGERSSARAPTAREMALGTLTAMAAGGIFDQVGGGFHRYAVDATWTVPHFEKMLYDNALLARAYLHGARLASDARLERVCRETLDWLLRDMRGAEGGFYAALDADSDGAEGSFYVWTVDELTGALGDDADAALAWLGASGRGNFSDPHHPRPGLNVLSARGPEPPPPQRARIRGALAAVRAQRSRPGLDDKRLTSWNALAIAALADAGATLSETRYMDAAIACAEFVLDRLRDERGRLLRTYSENRARLDGYLEDHAYLLEALLVLFEATCEERWFEHACELAEQIVERFADPGRGGFFTTASDQEALIARRKDIEDAPIPSGNASAALGLLRLSQLTGEPEQAQRADSALALLQEIAPRHPTAFGHLLQAMHWRLAPARPIACPVPGPAGDPTGSPGSGRAPTA
ncbi:MAG TPA: thioredoxin domain-containing protein [Solirubrobacteraceae bacterium]|nr:thioredoxin domain-containing protein [Solirubrobacteraceae bacterium]